MELFLVYLWLNTCNFLTQEGASTADLSQIALMRTALKSFSSSSIFNSCTECSQIFPQAILCRIQYHSDTQSLTSAAIQQGYSPLQALQKSPSTNLPLTSTSEKCSSIPLLQFWTGIFTRAQHPTNLSVHSTCTLKPLRSVPRFKS